MGERSIVWVKEVGVEFAEVSLRGRDLSAHGVAIGTEPHAYRLDYSLETGDDFVTSSLDLTCRGQGWRRELKLVRGTDGGWTANGSPLEGFANSVDCDLAWSPLTNTMPVLRHGLLSAGGPIEFVMAWVSVPDLTVHASRQRYTFVRREGEHSIVRYESASRDFVAELVFDSDGLVVAYPGIGRKVG